jgi:hypothetical protein
MNCKYIDPAGVLTGKSDCPGKPGATEADPSEPFSSAGDSGLSAGHAEKIGV